MISFREKTLAAVLSIAVPSILVSPTLMAAPYSKIVAFGDSLTDTGQYPDGASSLLGKPGNSRFINRVGPTYQAPEPMGDIALQHVSRALGLGELNPSTSSLSGVATGVFGGTSYGVGGNTTAAVLNSIVAPNGSVVDIPGRDATNPPFLIDPRIRNGYLIDNPEADAHALYYVNGGSNDIFNGLITDSVTASNAASNLATGFNALHDAGARYIMVSNIPELDGTALAFMGSQIDTGGAFNPIHPTVLGPLSRLYNQALYEEIRVSEANIIPLDVAGLLTEARNSPESFGFDSVNTCFDNARSDCIRDPQFGLGGVTPNPDRLLFNDGVHPTIAAQEVISDYMLSILEAPGYIAALPVFGLQVTQSDLKRQQNLLNDTRGIDTFGDWQVSVGLESHSYTTNNMAYDTKFSGDYAALSFSGQRRINSAWRVGGQLSIGESRFNSESDASYADIENVGISLVATYDNSRYFANAILQLDELRYANIRRHTPLGLNASRSEEGDTKGSNWGLATEIGYDLSFEGGNWRYGPRLDLYLADSQVDAYSEYSSTITALNFGDQSLASQQADVGVFAQYLSTDKTLSFTGKIGFVSEFDMEGDDLEASLRSLDMPSFHLPGYEPPDQVAISTQATLSYSPTSLSRVAIRYQALSADDRSRSIAANLTFHF